MKVKIISFLNRSFHRYISCLCLATVLVSLSFSKNSVAEDDPSSNADDSKPGGEAVYKTSDADWFNGEFLDQVPGESSPTYCEKRYGKAFFSNYVVTNGEAYRIICKYDHDGKHGGWITKKLPEPLWTEYEKKKIVNENLPPSQKNFNLDEVFSKKLFIKYKLEAECPKPTKPTDVRIDINNTDAEIDLVYRCFSDILNNKICDVKDSVAVGIHNGNSDSLIFEKQNGKKSYVSIVQVDNCAIPTCPAGSKLYNTELKNGGKKAFHRICVSCSQGEFDAKETYAKMLSRVEGFPASPLCKVKKTKK